MSEEDAREVFHFLSSPARKLSTQQQSSLSTRKNEPQKQGTLTGVFMPCFHSILNIILFLRLPSITAQAGMVQTTLIIVACASSTLITAISLGAIATNGKLGNGGPYYIISRTLGLEVGGALGLLYYLGSTMACSMCVLGGVEAFLLSVRGDAANALIETTNGALGGSYESTEKDFDMNEEGLIRRFLTQGEKESMQPMQHIIQPQQMGEPFLPNGAILTGSIEDAQNILEQELLPELAHEGMSTSVLSSIRRTYPCFSSLF